MASLSKKQKVIITSVVVPIAIILIVVGSVLISFAAFSYKKGEVEKATSIQLKEDGAYCVMVRR